MGSTNSETIATTVAETIRLAAPTYSGTIGPETLIGAGGIGLDSIGVLELVLELERRTGLELRDESLVADTLSTVGNLTTYLRRLSAS